MQKTKSFFESDAFFYLIISYVSTNARNESGNASAYAMKAI